MTWDRSVLGRGNHGGPDSGGWTPTSGRRRVWLEHREARSSEGESPPESDPCLGLTKCIPRQHEALDLLRTPAGSRGINIPSLPWWGLGPAADGAWRVGVGGLSGWNLTSVDESNYPWLRLSNRLKTAPRVTVHEAIFPPLLISHHVRH